MDMSARRAVSLWVPMTESFIHTMRLLVAAGSDQLALRLPVGCLAYGALEAKKYS
jgi:hypothetical protein